MKFNKLILLTSIISSLVIVGAVGVITHFALKHDHEFKKTYIQDEASNKEATCVNDKQHLYQYICDCGEISHEEIEVKEKNASNHEGEIVYRIDDNTHTLYWSCCEVEVAKEEHFGGEASCNELAKCEVCNKEYGEYLPHSFTLKSNSNYHIYECKYCEEEIKEMHTGGRASCTELARCEECEEEYGSYEEHNYVLKSNSNTHFLVCLNCGDLVNEELHFGKEATCTELARCEVCNESHGELKEHNYVIKNNETHEWEECDMCGDVDLSSKITLKEKAYNTYKNTFFDLEEGVLSNAEIKVVTNKVENDSSYYIEESILTDIKNNAIEYQKSETPKGGNTITSKYLYVFNDLDSTYDYYYNDKKIATYSFNDKVSLFHIFTQLSSYTLSNYSDLNFEENNNLDIYKTSKEYTNTDNYQCKEEYNFYFTKEGKLSYINNKLTKSNNNNNHNVSYESYIWIKENVNKAVILP